VACKKGKSQKCRFPIYNITLFAVGKAPTNAIQESGFSSVSFEACCLKIRLPGFVKMERDGATNYLRCAEILTASLDGFQTYGDVTSHIQRFGSRGNALTSGQEVPGWNARQCTGSSTEKIIITLRKYLRIPLYYLKKKTNCRDIN
jgi:hypothetical protein